MQPAHSEVGFTSLRAGAKVILTIFLAYAIAFADRGVIGLLVPGLKSDLHLSDTQVSLLQGAAFVVVYALGGLAIGRVADRANRRNLLIFGTVAWGLATIACGLANTFAQLFVARMFVGLGEACLAPAAVSLMADWFTPQLRGRAMGLVQAGNPVGNTAALVGGGLLISALSRAGPLASLAHGIAPWKVVFIAVGLPALLLAALIAPLREPARRETVSAQRGGDVEGLFRHMGRAPLAFLLFLTLLPVGTIIGYACNSWAPTILMRVYRLSPAEAGALFGFTVLIHAPLSGIIGGILSDALSRRRPADGRAMIPVLMLPLVILGTLWLLAAQHVWSFILALSIALFGVNLIVTSAYAALQELFPNRLRGQAVAFAVLITNLVGFGLAPTLVALVTDHIFRDEMKLQTAVGAISLAAAVVGLLIAAALPRFYRKASLFAD